MAADDMRGGELTVALVNNMPAAAKLATRQQFASLLAAAAQNLHLRVRLVTAEHFQANTDEVFAFLDAARPDALIVTGDQPQSETIVDEPLLPALARLVGWAAENTISATWSCLAAHAAVFALDGIERDRLPRKLSGVYGCEAAADHWLLAGFPARWQVPHSRYNGAAEAALRAKGYAILSHGPEIGADSFAKTVRGSLFVFLQGHPEYAADTLFKEYRRDVRRFLAGEIAVHPDIPENYVNPHLTACLERLRGSAGRVPAVKLLAALDAIDPPERDSGSPGALLCANWLAFVAGRNAARQPRLRRGAA